MMVVKTPVFLDLVQPDNAIRINKVITPIKKDKNPVIFGQVKSLSTTLKGYPCVVIITIFVIAKTVIKKLAAAIVVIFKIVFDNLFFVSLINKFAITAIEKPLNRELITINWFAILFR